MIFFWKTHEKLQKNTKPLSTRSYTIILQFNINKY